VSAKFALSNAKIARSFGYPLPENPICSFEVRTSPVLCDACIQPWSVPPPLVASGLRKASRYFCVIFASIRVRTALHRAILRLGPRFRRILETTLRWLRNPPLRYPYLPIEAPNSSASAFIPIQRRRVGQLCFSRFRGLSSSEKERSGHSPNHTGKRAGTGCGDKPTLSGTTIAEPSPSKTFISFDVLGHNTSGDTSAARRTLSDPRGEA
jgi:hypothetical protein